MQRSIFHAFKHLMQWHRTQKIAIAICVDLVLISLAFVGAFFIRLEDVSLLMKCVMHCFIGTEYSVYYRIF